MSVSAGSARAVDPHAGPGLAPPRTAVATVCLSGSLDDKLVAAAAAGFDGVEIFEPDFVASPSSAAEVRRRCADLGLTIDLYQPFRDFDSTDPQRLAANLRRAEHKFAVMEALGTDLILVCSSVSPDAVDDDGRIAEQLHTLGERAAARGMRVSYEALAWGRHVNTYDAVVGDRAPRRPPGAGPVRRQLPHPVPRQRPGRHPRHPRGEAVLPAAGRRPAHGHERAPVEPPPPPLPGQGAFDLPAFLGHVLAAGYGGPLSLEVFNDVFRQADPRRAAVDALRSLLALAEAVRDPAQGHLPAGVEVGGRSLPPTPGLHGFAFAELAVDDECEPRSRAPSPRSGSATQAPIAASRCSCGVTGRRACCSTPSRPHTAPPSRRSASRSTTRRPPRSARRGCSRRSSPAPAARPRRTCRPCPHRTGPRCSSAARGPTTGG